MGRLRGRYVALALSGVLLAGGCGTASPESPPSGVDGLTIPTPSPDAADFVARIDNPWLGWAPGRVWEYAARIDGLDYTRVVTVRPAPAQVAGVATTVVDTVTTPVPPATPSLQRDYYAQDRAGNVWWFGREGQWRAGEDGARAGLAMPATPRLGDGWRAAYGAGVVDVRASVSSTDQSATTPAGRFGDLLGLTTTSPLTPEEGAISYYARGVGLVEQVSTGGTPSLVRLEAAPR